MQKCRFSPIGNGRLVSAATNDFGLFSPDSKDVSNVSLFFEIKNFSYFFLFFLVFYFFTECYLTEILIFFHFNFFIKILKKLPPDHLIHGVSEIWLFRCQEERKWRSVSRVTTKEVHRPKVTLKLSSVEKRFVIHSIEKNINYSGKDKSFGPKSKLGFFCRKFRSKVIFRYFLYIC